MVSDYFPKPISSSRSDGDSGPRFTVSELTQATQALTHYARAIGAAHTGTPADVEKEVQKLTEIRDALVQAKQDYWAKQVEVQLQTAQAWLVWRRGGRAEGVKLMGAAADLEESTYKHPITPGQLLPARELLGDLLLDLQRPAGPAFRWHGRDGMAPVTCAESLPTGTGSECGNLLFAFA